VKPGRILGAGVLLAVATVVVAALLKESPTQPAVAPTPPVTASHRVVAYYFHRTVRCDTCRLIEAQARAVIETEFAAALQTGALEWHAINIEEPGNEAFAKAYDLTVPALVLVEFLDGRQARWTKLNRVWDLVQAPPAFAQYVQNEVHAYLGKTATEQPIRKDS